MRGIADIPDYRAAVEDHRNSRLGRKATGAEVVRANARHWDGYAAAGAHLELAVARVTQMHNESVALENGVNENTVKRAFQRIHSGWKKYRLALAIAHVPAVAGSEETDAGLAERQGASLTDNRPVGGRTFGGASA